ncbi:hypothetical protein A2U01_0073547, partial [Trifolium medium]|nr:hypothetical protein [Trifolium medium]
VAGGFPLQYDDVKGLVLADNTKKEEEIKELRRSQATWVEEKTKLEDFLKSSGSLALGRGSITS